MPNLIDRIDETREYWASSLEYCRNELLDTVTQQDPLARLVVELDYLLVEAKMAYMPLRNTIDSQQVWVEKYKAKNAALLEALEQMVSDTTDGRKVSQASINKAERAIRKTKEKR